MKIKEIKAAEINITPTPKTKPRSLPPPDRPDSPSPMARYPAYRKRRSLSGASWNRVGCVITAEDGTFGVGVTINGGTGGKSHQRPFCPTPCRRKLHGNREDV